MKALVLARVSTENQTLESQIEKLVNETKKLGYNDTDITIISGKESGVKLDIEERQTIQQLKSYVDTGEYDMVVIWEVSRLARRPKVLYEVREYLIERHVNLRCMTPSFTMLKEDGTIDPTASIVFALFGTMAEEEARLSKERMMRGKKHKQALNGNIGSTPLFGYKFENDILTVDYSKTEIIKKIYNMYEGGLSTRSIAIELMETGEIKRNKLSAANKNIQTIISRPEYYGGKSELSNYSYPAIVTKTQWDKCRKIASDRTKPHSRVKKITLGKGIIYCKDNNYKLTPNIAKGKYTMITLDRALNMTISIKLFDDFIWKLIKEHAIAFSDDKKNKEKLIEESYVCLRKVQQALRSIHDYEAQIERIENRIIEGKMSEIKGDKMIEEKKTLILEARETMDTNNYLYGIKQQMIHDASYKIDYDTIEDINEKKKIVDMHVEKVILEKTMIKRGHYIIEVHMKNGVIYKYYYWSSGPWHNIEKIKS